MTASMHADTEEPLEQRRDGLLQRLARSRFDDRVASALGVAAAIAVGLLAGAEFWVLIVAAAYTGGFSSGIRQMSATFIEWQRDQRDWANALSRERVADQAHQSTRGVRHPVLAAAELLEPRDQGDAVEIRRRFEAYRTRAREILGKWSESTSPQQAAAADEGFYGLALIAPSRSGRPLRRFATLDNTPAWLPYRLRERLVTLLRSIDVVRLLHSPDIERRALIVTMWLRAAIVVAAPFAMDGSLTGQVPLEPRTTVLADAIYGLIVACAVVCALIAPRLADYTIGQPTRVWLFGVEQVLTIAAVVAVPCWPVAVFGVGAVNWLERPDWTLTRLLLWMVLTYVPFTISAALLGVPAPNILGEFAIALSVTALIGGSYGLMFPATATTYLGALAGTIRWRVGAYRAVRRNTGELRDVIDLAEVSLARLDSRDPAVQQAIDGLARARDRLGDARDLLHRTPRILWMLCSRAITSVVPPLGSDTEARLSADAVVSDPPALDELILVSNRVARRLERLIKRIALEAVDNGGRDLLMPRFKLLADGDILMQIANGLPLPGEDSKGFETGYLWLDRWCAGIPGAKQLPRGEMDGEGFDVPFRVFAVQIRIGRAAFRGDSEHGKAGGPGGTEQTDSDHRV